MKRKPCYSVIQIFNEKYKSGEKDKQKLTSRSCKLCTLTQVFYRFIELIEILLFVIEHAILYFIIRAYINSCSTAKHINLLHIYMCELFFCTRTAPGTRFEECWATVYNARARTPAFFGPTQQTALAGLRATHYLISFI